MGTGPGGKSAARTPTTCIPTAARPAVSALTAPAPQTRGQGRLRPSQVRLTKVGGSENKPSVGPRTWSKPQPGEVDQVAGSKDKPKRRDLNPSARSKFKPGEFSYSVWAV